MNGIEFALPGVNLFNLYQYMVIFFVSSLRIASFLISAPFFSLGGIPLQVRIIASISLTAFFIEVVFPKYRKKAIIFVNSSDVFSYIIR